MINKKPQPGGFPKRLSCFFFDIAPIFHHCRSLTSDVSTAYIWNRIAVIKHELIKTNHEKKHFFYPDLHGLFCSAQKQEMPTKKSFFEILALLCVNVYNVYHEYNFSKSFALRTEINLERDVFSRGDFTNKSGFALTPDISLALRWYYNINKIEKESNTTRFNSANYVSAKIGFYPGLVRDFQYRRLNTNPTAM